MKIYKTLRKVFKKYRGEEENSITYEEAKAILKNDKEAILIDVRSPQEYNEGHLPGSINFPLFDLERDKDKLLFKKENTIILYCQYGFRSKRALKILKEQGYLNLYQIDGGIDEI